MSLKLKKSRKSKKHRGSHTHGRGFKKKARGSGHRGGIGKAGSGKRADHKKKLKKGEDYFGKRRVKNSWNNIKLETMNLSRLINSLEGKKEIELKGYKLVGKTEIKEKLKISVNAISAGARESVEKAGGQIVIIGEKKEIEE
ncbi:MAG: uL15m family ribosomal protein [Candidatus Pacearchaeota archaeon]|nr:uL15m family ribosomal protein [Candidatus Pacearchaeota archaeon]